MSTNTRPEMAEPAVGPPCEESCRHRCPECRMGLGSHLECDPLCDHSYPGANPRNGVPSPCP